MLEQHDKAAEMLLVGFCKSWKLWEVALAVGCDPGDDGMRMRLTAACPFMPSNLYHYKRPVRAFVVSAWPKLADYLIRNEGAPGKVLAVVEQVKRLKAPEVSSGGYLSADDSKEGRKARAAYRHTKTANQAALKQQLSTQRGAWNVCKG